MFDILSVCLVLTALFAYTNHRVLGLPTTIGVMAVAVLISIAFIVLDRFGLGDLHDYERALVDSVDFPELLLQGMLGFLLFAGALHVNLDSLRAQFGPIMLLAVIGTALSTVVVGVAMWCLLPLTGFSMDLRYCLLFGALIAPTDPIAVLAILKSLNAPKPLEITIAGESLLNDGVGVVFFLLLMESLHYEQFPSFAHAAYTMAREVGGGLALGGAVGYLAYRMLKSIDESQTEILITLAAVTGGYALASHLHVSGPLAMVVIGVLLGNHGREFAMSDTTRAHVDTFWELVDQLLNAVLFVLLGLQMTQLEFADGWPWAALLALMVTLLARLVSVSLPLSLLRTRLPRGSLRILLWGGLRGGISVALALSLPAGEERGLVLTLTYTVVVFSVLVQGATMAPVMRRALAPPR